MLYLAEVIRQNRAFMGGMKTELKLLACQHNDQTWSAIPNDEMISTEEVEQALGEGTLMTVQLGMNKQIQEVPKLAGTELVRQLQRLSRLSEKLKDQQDEIEQWKQSLTYQSQELSRREMEIQSQFEQLEEMEQEYQQIERRCRDVEEAEERIARKQQQLDAMKDSYGLSVELPPDQMSRLKTVIHRLSHKIDENDVPWNYTRLALEALQHQKKILLGYWEQLRQQQGELEEKRQALEVQHQNIQRQKQELTATQQSLAEIRTQVQVQQAILESKQDLLSQLSVNRQLTEDIRECLEQGVSGTAGSENHIRIDVHSLEEMPLSELERVVNSLKEDLDKIVQFVNDQEEELSLQIQGVNELQAKLETANEYDRVTLEQELADEQEAKRMLDETLVGQRRTLKERQDTFMGHLRILRRRQGVIDLEEHEHYRMNLEPILQQLEAASQEKTEEIQRLESEIEQLRSSLSNVKDVLGQQESEYQNKADNLAEQEQAYQQSEREFIQLETRLHWYQEALQPIQDEADKLGQLLEGLSQWFIPMQE
ncbi:MAG: pilus motility taxis protein HmpF [Microcystaceae cyanobacterium]